MSFLSRIGSGVRSSSTAKAKVLAKRSKYGIAAAGTRTSKKAASTAMSAAITKNQARAGAGVLGIVGTGMLFRGRGSSSTRGGYNPPTVREPRGSGRYA